MSNSKKIITVDDAVIDAIIRESDVFAKPNMLPMDRTRHRCPFCGKISDVDIPLIVSKYDRKVLEHAILVVKNIAAELNRELCTEEFECMVKVNFEFLKMLYNIESKNKKDDTN